MIRRLYVHNYRCLENFELPVQGLSSVLLIGKNGSGKTTAGQALEVLQRIGRGINRVDDLVKPKDFARGRSDVPIRFELGVHLGGKEYEYSVAFDFPSGFKELRVCEEKFSAGGIIVYNRVEAQVQMPKSVSGQEREAKFRIDWHLVALPVVQEQSETDPLFVFKQWLAQILILRPQPVLISGESRQETLRPDSRVREFGAWFAGLIAHAPAAYAQIDEYLKTVLPDLKDIRNPMMGKEYRSLVVQFSNEQGTLSVPFEDLSDGEKCFMICAMVIASNRYSGPVLCFWDEPDNYLSLDEVQHFVRALRNAFESQGGQFIATSHNAETIRCFSDENTLLLYRRSHLEPTVVRAVSDLPRTGNLVDLLMTGDLEP